VALDHIQTVDRSRVATLELTGYAVPRLDRREIPYVLNFDLESVLL